MKCQCRCVPLSVEDIHLFHVFFYQTAPCLPSGSDLKQSVNFEMSSYDLSQILHRSWVARYSFFKTSRVVYPWNDWQSADAFIDSFESEKPTSKLLPWSFSDKKSIAVLLFLWKNWCWISSVKFIHRWWLLQLKRDLIQPGPRCWWWASSSFWVWY